MRYDGYRPTLRERMAAFFRRVARRLDPAPDYATPPFRLLIEPGSSFGTMRIKLEANSHGLVVVRTYSEYRTHQIYSSDVLDLAYRLNVAINRD